MFTRRDSSEDALRGEKSRVSTSIPSGGRTRSLFDLTIVDWKLYYTANEHGFKFYPIISNFLFTITIRDNAFILHSKLNDIYFVVNFEFTSSIFLFPKFHSKLTFLENFPITINCGEI